MVCRMIFSPFKVCSLKITPVGHIGCRTLSVSACMLVGKNSKSDHFTIVTIPYRECCCGNGIDYFTNYIFGVPTDVPLDHSVYKDGVAVTEVMGVTFKELKEILRRAFPWASFWWNEKEEIEVLMTSSIQRPWDFL